MTITLILCSLPKARACLVSNDDGSYTICVNKSLSREDAKKAVLHEIGHIYGDDFHKKKHATVIEALLHNELIDDDIEGINFYCHVM